MFAVADLTNEDNFMVGVYSYAKFSKIIVMYFIFYFIFIYEYFVMQINKYWTSKSKP